MKIAVLIQSPVRLVNQTDITSLIFEESIGVSNEPFPVLFIGFP